jgi:hypothetical protein
VFGGAANDAVCLHLIDRCDGIFDIHNPRGWLTPFIRRRKSAQNRFSGSSFPQIVYGRNRSRGGIFELLL